MFSCTPFATACSSPRRIRCSYRIPPSRSVEIRQQPNFVDDQARASLGDELHHMHSTIANKFSITGCIQLTQE